MTTTDHASPSYSQLRPSSPSSQSSQASESHGTRKNRGVSSRRVSPQNRISGDMNEQSPLLEPRDSHDDGPKRPVSPLADAGWEDGQGTKSIWYLILLTLGGVGLQIAWSVETSYGSVCIASPNILKRPLICTSTAILIIIGSKQITPRPGLDRRTTFWLTCPAVDRLSK